MTLLFGVILIVREIFAALKDIKERSSKSLLANVLDMDDDIRMSSSYLRMESADMSSPCALAQRDLQGILREIRFITARMRKSEDDAEVVGDWKFAAMVVDRMCLIVFTSFTIIATVSGLNLFDTNPVFNMKFITPNL